MQIREQKTYQVESIIIEIDHDIVHNKAEVTIFDNDNNVICSFKSVDEAQEVASAITKVTGEISIETPESSITIEQLNKTNEPEVL